MKIGFPNQNGVISKSRNGITLVGIGNDASEDFWTGYYFHHIKYMKNKQYLFSCIVYEDKYSSYWVTLDIFLFTPNTSLGMIVFISLFLDMAYGNNFPITYNVFIINYFYRPSSLNSK